MTHNLDAKSMSLTDMRQLLGDFFTKNPQGSELWDLLSGCVRGPDSPSEWEGDPCYNETYALRRARKHKGIEVLRWMAFFGKVGGGARKRAADDVELVGDPTDHHNRHLIRAANILGLKIVYPEKKKNG